jgi:hypothetical protein
LDGTTWSLVGAATVAGATSADLTGVATFGTGYAAAGTSSSASRSDAHTLVEQCS